MEGSKRDETQDWILPEGARPPLVGDLVRRIDEALAISRASEAVVMTVGAAALDAAEQASRAAKLAERASAAMLSQRRASEVVTPQVGTGEEVGTLRSFTARADRVVARLRALERIPARSHPASAAADRWRSAR
jgi:hypothetical protein